MQKRMLVGATPIVLWIAMGFAMLAALDPARADDTVPQSALGEQSMTFAIENMTCVLCPVTVKKAIAGVPGVKSVTVEFEARTATVVFDPSAVSPADIAAASTNAGYPAKARLALER